MGELKNNHYIKFRCETKIRKKLEADIKKAGHNPNKDKSKWMRTLIMNKGITFFHAPAIGNAAT